MAEDDKTSFTGKLDTHTKTARPANVGPHDYAKEQHDPHKRGVTPEDYKPQPGDSASGPAAPGGPVNIRPKGAAAGGRPDDSGGAAKPDAGGAAPETKATGRGKAASGGGLAEE